MIFTKLQFTGKLRIIIFRETPSFYHLQYPRWGSPVRPELWTKYHSDRRSEDSHQQGNSGGLQEKTRGHREKSLIYLNWLLINISRPEGLK